MRYVYFSLLLLTSSLWAGNFIISKSLVEHASSMTLTSLRWIIAILVLLPVVWWKERKILPSRDALFPLFLMGITGVTLFNLLQFAALEHTSATNAGLISTFNMISIALFSFIFLKEQMNRRQILSIIFSFLGVMLVLSKGHIDLFLSLQFNLGDGYMFAAVAIWGIYSVCSKWALSKTSAMMATLYSGIFGLLVLLPFNLSSFAVSNINASFIQSMLYTGVISTVVCTVLWNLGVKHVGATVSGLFLNFNPIFTAIFAFLFLGEQMTSIQVIGSSIVIAGCYAFSHFKTKNIPNKTDVRHSLQN